MGLFDGFASQSGGGMLGGFNMDDPKTVGLMNMAAQLLAASGPSTKPVSLGQAFGSAASAGMGAYGDARKQQRKESLENAQLKILSNKSAKEEAMLDAQREWMKSFGTSANSSPSLPGQLGSGMFGEVSLPENVPAMPPQKQGGNLPSLEKIMQGALLGVPGMNTVFDVTKYAKDGVKRDPNSFYENPMTGKREYIPDVKSGIGGYDPATNTMKPIGGFPEFQADIEGKKTAAQEGAKANFDLLPLGYVGPDGRPMGGTRASYINRLNQPQATSPSSSQRTTSPAGFPKISPEVQQGRDSEALQIIQAELAAETNPQNRAALGREVTRMQGNIGGPSLQSEAEKKQQLGQIEVKQGAQTKLNENWITNSYNPAIESGRTAQSMVTSLDALKGINLKTGWGTEAQANAANILTTLGVAPKNAEMFATNAQRFQSVAMDRLLISLQAQKGMQTEGDSTRAQATFAQLKNTPMANEFIADFARAKANEDARKAQFYQEALPLAQESGDLNEVDRRWGKLRNSIWNDPALQRWKAK